MGGANVVSRRRTVNDPGTWPSGVLQTRDEQRRAPLDVLSRGRFRSGQAGVGRRSGESRRARPEALGRPRLPDERPRDRCAHAGAHRHRQGWPGARPRAHRRGDLRLRQPQEPGRSVQGRGRPAARRDQRRAPRGEDAAGVRPAHPGRHRQEGLHLDQPRGRRRSGPHLRRHRLQRRRRHHRDVRRGRRHPRAHPRDRRRRSAPCPIAPASPASTARSPTPSSPRRGPTAPGTPGARRAPPTFFPSAPNERPPPPRPSRPSRPRSTTTLAAAGWRRSTRARCRR